MGEYLSTPNKTKMSSDGEGGFVSDHFKKQLKLTSFYSLGMELQECRAGARAWKTLTLLISM
jgi:hypothetical protein